MVAGRVRWIGCFGFELTPSSPLNPPRSRGGTLRRWAETAGGAGGVDVTTANALRVRDFIGMGDVPVVPGSTRPLLRPPLQARHVHGETGLGSAKLPEALSGPAPGHAVDF